MNDKPLGRFVRVDLRDLWKDEARDFTPWLEENIDLLGEAIGLELEVVERERAIGPFSADLACRDTAGGTWVLVENQLGRTDHTHLGQLLTYAAGLDAVTIVWIARQFTDEHRAALDWLNESTGEDINFFGIEVEAWRIEDSVPAPRFSIVSKPNEWSKAVRAQRSSAALTEGAQLQLRYWTGFRDFLREHDFRLGIPKPHPQNWYPFSVGKSNFGILAIASHLDSEKGSYANGELRVQLHVSSDPQRILYDRLRSRAAEIEAQIDDELTWHVPEGTKSWKLYVRRPADISSESQWPEQFAWLKERVELFNRVFRPIIRELA